MEPENVIKLFDSCWYDLDVLTTPSSSLKLHSSPSAAQPRYSSLRSILVRSKSEEIISMNSFNYGSSSPNSVLFPPQLQNIFLGKEVTAEERLKKQESIKSRKDGFAGGSDVRSLIYDFSKQESFKSRTNSFVGGSDVRSLTIDIWRQENIVEQFQEVQKQKRNLGGLHRSKTRGKSLSELEFEEIKGFMDLGFVFSEEDRETSLVEILPGLNRLGKENEEKEVKIETIVQRPYLSEAWEVLDRRRKLENNLPLMNWRIPDLSNEISVKDSLKMWAHNVASAVK